MKKYKAIIFDIDGTILDTARMNIIPLQGVLERRFHKHYTYEELEPLVGYSGVVILKKMGFAKEEIDDVLQEWIRDIQHSGMKAELFEGMKETLMQLQALHIPMGIVSSKEIKQYHFDMVSQGLDSFFSSVVLADDTKLHKPHPDPLTLCMKQMHVNEEEALYIGDTDADALCAKAAGCDFAYAAWGPLTLQEPCTYTLSKPMDILTIVQEDK